jgi:hypothetical protein
MKRARIFTISLKNMFNHYEKQYLIIIFVFSTDEPTLPIPPLNFPE